MSKAAAPAGIRSTDSSDNPDDDGSTKTKRAAHADTAKQYVLNDCDGKVVVVEWVSLEDIVVSVVSAWVHRLSGMTIERFLHADQWAWKTAIWSGTGVLTVSALYLRHLHIDRSAQWRLDAVADNERPMDIGQPSIGASVRFLTDQTIPWRGQEHLFSVASRLSAAARRMPPSRR